MMADVIEVDPDSGATGSALVVGGVTMRILVLPPTPRGEAHIEQVTVLSGVAWTIRLDFVQRLGRWTLTLARPDGRVVLRAKPCVVGADMARYVPELPGALTVVDTRGDVDPWYSDMGPGGTHALTYVEPVEAA